MKKKNAKSETRQQHNTIIIMHKHNTQNNRINMKYCKKNIEKLIQIEFLSIWLTVQVQVIPWNTAEGTHILVYDLRVYVYNKLSWIRNYLSFNSLFTEIRNSLKFLGISADLIAFDKVLNFLWIESFISVLYDKFLLIGSTQWRTQLNGSCLLGNIYVWGNLSSTLLSLSVGYWITYNAISSFSIFTLNGFSKVPPMVFSY